jgi:signal transduction histidine kinase/DNA-binding NarL/FixJ family response regulator
MKNLDILIAEDYEVDYIHLKHLLQTINGYKINLFHSPSLEGVLTLLRENTFDAILLDLGLEDSSGLNTFNTIKINSGETPIIVLSDLVDEETALNTLSLGAQDYILKNFISGGSLIRTIQFAIERENIKIILEKSQFELMTRNEIAYAFLNYDDDEVFDTLLNTLLKNFKKKYGFFGYIDPQGNLVCPTMTKDIWDLCDMPDKTMVFPKEQWGGVWGDALKNSMTTFKTGNLNVPDGHISLKSAVSVPIEHKGELIGLFSLADSDKVKIQQSEIDILNRVADYIAPLLKSFLERNEKKYQEELYKKEILNLNELLECKVFDRTKELEKSNHQLLDEILQRKMAQKELRKAMATKDRFFSIIAHDLGNILQTLLSNSEFMVNFSQEIDSGQTNKTNKRINETALKLNELFKSLLLWSRSQQGVVEFNPMMNNIRTTIKNTINNFSETAKKKSIRITYNIDKDQFAKYDLNMVSTILRNLINNAIKFTNNEGEIKIESAVVNNYLMVYVEDSGVGIPEEAIDKIFKIDQNYTSVGTNRERGSGLGLIICKEFIENHEGHIWVESKEGRGSRFSFNIPQKKEINLEKEKISPIYQAQS